MNRACFKEINVYAVAAVIASGSLRKGLDGIPGATTSRLCWVALSGCLHPAEQRWIYMKIFTRYPMLSFQGTQTFWV